MLIEMNANLLTTKYELYIHVDNNARKGYNNAIKGYKKG